MAVEQRKRDRVTPWRHPSRLSPPRCGPAAPVPGRDDAHVADLHARELAEERRRRFGYAGAARTAAPAVEAAELGLMAVLTAPGATGKWRRPASGCRTSDRAPGRR